MNTFSLLNTHTHTHIETVSIKAKVHFLYSLVCVIPDIFYLLM